ncbi:MAG: DUF882 domain-containing protein [Alphaproteobacteria bacterium]|nr:DUF882 domain-containing protein [Alphaproteobacteria bacterium]
MPVPVDTQGHPLSDETLRERLELLSARLGGATVRVLAGDLPPERAGSPQSPHLAGKAADIRVPGLTTREVSEAAARSGLFDGVGHYDASPRHPAHTHVDLGGRRPDGTGRRWAVGADDTPKGWHDDGHVQAPRSKAGDS